MEQTGEHAAALSPRTIPPRGTHRAALAVRLSAVIVTATIAEPRVLTVRLGDDPLEALPSGPLEVEHRTSRLGCGLGRAVTARSWATALHFRRSRGRDRRALTVAYLALLCRRAGVLPRRSGRAVSVFSVGGRTGSRRRSPARSASEPIPSGRGWGEGGCARRGSVRLRPLGTRNWSRAL
jgi:hypothetical protein